MSKSFLNNHFNRGLRNNNPGNLVKTSEPWKGKIPQNQNPDIRFEQFVNISYGLRALMVNLNTHFKRGENTLAKIISVYAPSFENNTNSYIDTVTRIVGIGKNQQINTLTPDLIISIAKAIVFVELGKDSKLLEHNDYVDAYKILDSNYIERIKQSGSYIIPLLVFFYSLFTIII